MPEPILNRENLVALFDEQLASWEQAGNNYKALERVIAKGVDIDGFPFKVQFNPARIVSSAAKVDTKSIQERKCFLCSENRPAVQKGLEYIHNGDRTDVYTVLVNPFPIFPKHLTIPLLAHKDQAIRGRFDAMADLASLLTEYTLFYNGPKCGASAPDHFHFQAGNRGFLPIEDCFDKLQKKEVTHYGNSIVYQVLSAINGLIIVKSSSRKELIDIFYKIYSLLEVKEGETEPMLNILCWFEKGIWTTAMFIRSKHRPSHYFAEGDGNILISPAAVDLGGVFITPLEKDFEKISAKDIKNILNEVCISFDELEVLCSKIKLKL